MKVQHSPRSGIALVIVLGFLVILSALAVAFFSSVTTELKSSRNFASGVSTRQLAESAVAVVEGQIRDASSRQGMAWASQPGMIRVFDTTGPNAFFKLYSSPNMVVTKTNITSDPITGLPFDPTSDYVVDWDKKSALYTDLNSPLVIADPGNPTAGALPHFPIIDPRVYSTAMTNRNTTDPTNSNVEGFWYGTDANKPAVVVPDGLVAPAGSANDQRLPMPARWIYVLQDGSLTSPPDANLSNNGTLVTWDPATTAGRLPTKANPIVGRIAFWTDDETSKVNINTAGGYVDGTPPTGYTADTYAGSFWDTPRLYTDFDQGLIDATGVPQLGKGGLAVCQLLQNEFQRYPGHPATTSLGIVFKNILTSEEIYKVSPRLQFNTAGSTTGLQTSSGGTNRVSLSVAGVTSTTTVQNVALQVKTDRLYASIDELLFSPKITGAGARITNDSTYTFASGLFTPTTVEKLRFFLTATSRAPETNLFGFPRVSVWPVHSETPATTAVPANSGLNAFDKVIQFCSTVGKPSTSTSTLNSAAAGGVGPFRYIFFRGDSVSPTNDIQLGRNKELIGYASTTTGYLQKLTAKGKTIPGFAVETGGNNFEDKYGTADRDQLLVEMFDYIRCANLKDTTTMSSTVPQNTQQFAPLGIVVPAHAALDGGKQIGLGRFPTISEATLVFYYAGPGDPATAGNVDSTSTPAGKPANRYMRAFLLLSTFNPMQGYAPLTPKPGTSNLAATDPRLIFKVSGLNAFMANGKSLGFPAAATNVVNSFPGQTWGGRNFGGFEGFMHTLFNPVTPFKYAAPGSTPGDPYLLQTPSPGIPIPQATQNFAFTGGNVTVQIYYDTPANAASTSNLMQTVTLNFPSSTTNWPVPKGDPILDNNGLAAAPLSNYYFRDDGGFYPDSDRATTKPTNFTMQTLVKGSASPVTAVLNAYTPAKWGVFPAASPVYPAAGATGFQIAPYAWYAWDFNWRLYWASLNSYEPEMKPPLPSTTPLNWNGNRWRQIVQPGDTVRSIIYGGSPAGTIGQTNQGDLRLALVTDTIPASAFNPHPDYQTAAQRACMLRTGDGTMYFNYVINSSKVQGTMFVNNVTSGVDYVDSSLDGNPFGTHVKFTTAPKTTATDTTAANRIPPGIAIGSLPFGTHTSAGVNGVKRLDGGAGDFDTGVGNFADGPFGGKQDEGNVVFAYKDANTGVIVYPVPYFGTWQYVAPGNAFTSPSRQMPSPVMMGSLPSRVNAGILNPANARGWETLCFCPNPAGPNHPGNDSVAADQPKDHLLLDLFQMPVVEPYPISEPFSTAGKVNLNYMIAPYGYITRTTALRAALHPVRVTAVPISDYAKYKTGVSGAPVAGNPYRFRLDRDKTIQAFDNFLGQSDMNLNFFKSATQICERFLYPIGQGSPTITPTTTLANETTLMNQWWGNYTLTGDNLREKPYADLYPRLTTKSNTYTVHFRVQTLRQLPRSSTVANAYGTWQEGKDEMLGEYRGSTTIERYIDPSDPRFDSTNPASSGGFTNPDNVTGSQSLDTLYRFRVVGSKKFAP